MGFYKKIDVFCIFRTGRGHPASDISLRIDANS